METNITLQENTPLAKCQLWDLQKEFFCQQGIHAWDDDKVPFYITSNPYIAYSYANIIIRFMQDYNKLGCYIIPEPFYIVELGAGSGQFSFYLLKHLLALQEILQLKKQKFVYVMSDFNKHIIEYWQQHTALQPFITMGVLDFAVYDTVQGQSLELLHSGRTINQQTRALRPLIVIANYVFDSIPHDLFQIKNGHLQEGLVNLSVPSSHRVDNKPQELKAVDIKLNYQPASQPYYSDTVANHVLDHYLHKYNTGYLVFPIGALHCINHLHEMTKGNLLLLVTDKGYASHIKELIEKRPRIDFRGCISFEVNFDAIGHYSKQHGGDYYFSAGERYIISAAFLFGKTFAKLPELQQALYAFFGNYSPSNLFSIYELLKRAKQTGELGTLLSLLNITHWDPELFNICIDVILAQIPSSQESTLQALSENLEYIAANYYHMPGAANTLANVGLVYQALSEFAQALKYYQLSIEYIEPTVATYFNMGVCYHGLREYKAAIEMFGQVLEKEPDNMLACGWLTDSVKQSKCL